jgi:hypothetical protein
MITDVINAMRALIAQSFPNIPIYISNQGEGFQRPSFFISYINSSTKNLSKLVFNNTVTIQIVYFAPLDDYKNVQMANQWQTWDTLKEIFNVGFFNVTNTGSSTLCNVAKIINITGAPRNAEIYLNVNLQITEQRTDFDNDMSSNTQLMENIKLNIQEGN